MAPVRGGLPFTQIDPAFPHEHLAPPPSGRCRVGPQRARCKPRLDTSHCDWDLTSANWKEAASGTPIPFSQGDDVRFDDSGLGQASVALGANLLSPASVVVDSSTGATPNSRLGLSGGVTFPADVTLNLVGISSAGPSRCIVQTVSASDARKRHKRDPRPQRFQPAVARPEQRARRQRQPSDRRQQQHHFGFNAYGGAWLKPWCAIPTGTSASPTRSFLQKPSGSFSSGFPDRGSGFRPSTVNAGRAGHGFSRCRGSHPAAIDWAIA